ncbi:MAG: hypothetical protein LBR74_03455 [Eubacterium sp.]|jgi:KaiC/GvpD/RAD55 family RecA-like ATPase|nr:hypothetical protein [Eubacterium sp.]
MSNLKHNRKNLICYSKRSVVFEDNLDILFNRSFIPKEDEKDNNYLFDQWKSKSKLEQQGECIFANSKSRDDINKVFTGGLIIPTEQENGTGNIVISGAPGTGKSTLVFQIAAKCINYSGHKQINGGIALYYALEQPRQRAINSFVKDENDPRINRMKGYLPKQDSNKNPAVEFEKMLNKENGKVIPQIVFPLLSPLGFQSDENEKSQFEIRYKELEMALMAASKYNETRGKKDTKVVIVAFDGLNLFDEKPLSRTQLFRIFDLFSRYHFLSVFSLEDCTAVDETGTDYIKNVKFRADVVVSLSTSHFGSHHETYIEIEKSRHVLQTPGRHPYKIRSTKKEESFLKKYIEVFLSVHYLMSAIKELKSGTEEIKLQDSEEERNRPRNIFGIEAIDRILPEFFRELPKSHSQILSITGKTGLYKSDLAVNALLFRMFKGSVNEEEGENALIIRLSDRESFDIDGVRLCKEVCDIMRGGKSIVENKEITFEIPIKERDVNGEEANLINISSYKCISKCWNINGKDLIELTFTSGALMPEEFLDVLYNFIRLRRIKNIAFLGLKVIGVSYPFLCESEISGKLFLSAFEQISRKFRINLIVSASSSNVKESEAEINKMIELSDTCINLSTDEQSEDKEKVYISGVGSMIEKEKYYVKDTLYTNNRGIELKNGKILSTRFKIKYKDNTIKTTPKLKVFKIEKEESKKYSNSVQA